MEILFQKFQVAEKVAKQQRKFMIREIFLCCIKVWLNSINSPGTKYNLPKGLTIMQWVIITIILKKHLVILRDRTDWTHCVSWVP